MAVLKDTLVSGDLSVAGSLTSTNAKLLDCTSLTDMTSSGLFSNAASGLTVSQAHIYRDGAICQMHIHFQSSNSIADNTTVLKTVLKPQYTALCPIYTNTYRVVANQGFLINSSGEFKVRTSASIAANTEIVINVTYILA